MSIFKCVDYTNDIFQSLYGFKPRYIDDEYISSVSKRFNKKLLESIMSVENYKSVKSVCEGKELPSLGAAEEFIEKLAQNLDKLMEQATGGKGKIDALEKMEKDAEELKNQLSELIKQREILSEQRRTAVDKKIKNTANRILSKQDQIEMYAGLIETNMTRHSPVVRVIVSSVLQAANDKAHNIADALTAWGDGSGEMSKNDINTEVLKRMAKSKKLMDTAKYFGRYKSILNSKRKAGYTYGRGEKYDIEYGNNVTHAITSELAMLAAPELMPLFLRKHINKRLKQYRRREAEHKGRGDIIVCLDESGSTQGIKNDYGTAIAMVLYEICRINGTNFALVHFSKDVKTDYFSKDEKFSSEKLFDSAETFLGGGTDFEKPLDEAMRISCEEKLTKPDIVFITDGMCGVSEDFIVIRLKKVTQ